MSGSNRKKDKEIELKNLSPTPTAPTPKSTSSYSPPPGGPTSPIEERKSSLPRTPTERVSDVEGGTELTSFRAREEKKPIVTRSAEENKILSDIRLITSEIRDALTKIDNALNRLPFPTPKIFSPDSTLNRQIEIINNNILPKLKTIFETDATNFVSDKEKILGARDAMNLCKIIITTHCDQIVANHHEHAAIYNKIELIANRNKILNQCDQFISGLPTPDEKSLKKK